MFFPCKLSLAAWRGGGGGGGGGGGEAAARHPRIRACVVIPMDRESSYQLLKVNFVASFGINTKAADAVYELNVLVCSRFNQICQLFSINIAS
jgi:hypothetical protein